MNGHTKANDVINKDTDNAQNIEEDKAAEIDKNAKPSKWTKQRAKRKNRKKRKKQRKQQLAQEVVKLHETHELLNKPKEIEIDYVSESLSETAKTKFGKAFERFTPAEDLFKSKEQLLKEAADKEKAKKQREKEEKEKLRREDPIEAAIPLKSEGHKKKNDNGMDVDGGDDDDEHSHHHRARHLDDDDEADDDEEDDKHLALSNKQRKELQRPSIAALKKAVERSDLVEEHDVNAPDPFLLIELKSMRNTVCVPSHWSQKRKYLQGKRGFLKPPFKLPPYIEATGISKMRENRLNLLSEKSMKQKQRERMRPKKGGLEISYKVLHEAFFRHQTKPEDLTGFGDLYYEGKESMMRFRRLKPGYISDKLKKALAMSPRYRVVSPSGVIVQNKKEDSETGEVSWFDVQELKYGQYVVWDANVGPTRIRISAPVTGFVWLSSKDGKEEKLKRCDVEDPPPWLINMQRFGPPPSYPDLKIPGLNAPIPTHKMYGFHEGQWGKPPVDENGQPLYGDPFGIWTEPISKSWGAKSRWGVLEKFDDDDDEEDDEDEDEEEEEEEEGDEEEQEEDHKAVHKEEEMMETAADGTLSEISSVPSHINLRKNTVINDNEFASGIETPTSGISTHDIVMREEQPPSLYHVLPETQHAVGSGKFGSSKLYQMPATSRKRPLDDDADVNPPPNKKMKT